MKIPEIDIKDYHYDLPPDRIAQYPVSERDMSQLLVFKDYHISKDIFLNIDSYIPPDSLLVFNNTRVIRARILFRKESGAGIEILCLEPLAPSEYELSFGSKIPVEWKCIVGNLKKWKKGEIVKSFFIKEIEYKLTAQKIRAEGEAWRIRFSWNSPVLSFAEVIEATGHIPLPPYISREDETEDITRYQTVYSKIKGSVAAPTAGLHFTDSVINTLKERGTGSVEITLHVGAGTFKPIKTSSISDHEMHCEHFYVTNRTIESILRKQGKIIAVGTTSVRTLESIYWLGVRVSTKPDFKENELSLGQWDAYSLDQGISVSESLNAVLEYMKLNNFSTLHCSTSIMIVPGYKFRIINGLITNFHQPDSTLLLLISAWIGDKWREVYRFALENKFRFLSYGDCSLLFKHD